MDFNFLRVLAPLLCADLLLSACATRPAHEHHSTDADVNSADLKSAKQAEETYRASLGSQEVGEVKTTGACMDFKGALKPIIKTILGVQKESDPPFSSIRVPAIADVFSCPSEHCIDVYMEDPEENLKIQSVFTKLLDKAEDLEEDRSAQAAQGNVFEQAAGHIKAAARKVGDVLGAVEGSTIVKVTNIVLVLKVRLNHVTWEVGGASIKDTCLSLGITVTIPQLTLTVAGGKSKLESNPQQDWTIDIDEKNFKLCKHSQVDRIGEQVAKKVLWGAKKQLGRILVGALKGEILKAIEEALNKYTDNLFSRGGMFIGDLIPRLAGVVDKSQAKLTGQRVFADTCN